VANGSGCLFTRAAAGGLDTMGQLLAERRSLTLEHARQWMVHTGLETPVEDLAGEPELIAATRSVLDDGVHQLADTLRNSLNFYGMQDGAQAIERGLVTGPAVNIPGFVATLSDLLHIPLVPATVAAADPELDVGSLTVAAGLALESRT
jgi:type IV pilus assembly protein PilM